MAVWRISSLGAVCAVLVGAAAWYALRPSTASLLDAAQAAVIDHEYDRARELTSQVLARDSKSVDARILAAQVAATQDEPLEAITLIRGLPADAKGRDVIEALVQAGQLAIKSGRAADAEWCHRRVLELDPGRLEVVRRLSALYLGESRRWESAPLLLTLLRGKAFTLEELAFLGNLEELYDSESLMTFFEESVPGDLIPMMGRARLLLFKNFTEQGTELLQRIVASHPEFVEAQAQMGVVIVSQSESPGFLEWHQRLPKAADDHPEIWWVRATQARKIGDTKGAIRCAWEALKLDPNHLGATYQLSQLLAIEGRADAAKVFAARAARLEALAAAIHDILLRKATADGMRACAKLCEELGRIWEAWGWNVALETYHPTEAHTSERARLRDLLTEDLPQTLPDHQLAAVYDLSSFPLPRWQPVTGKQPSQLTSDSPRARFADVGGSVGLDFEYKNGLVPGRPGFKVYQSIGGGCGVLDFDRNGLPDIVFPQAGGDWNAEVPAGARTDRLFQNLGRAFRDVTTLALPPDDEFGFGLGVGDVNADGFPDLYLANGRHNRLFFNQGDGTFVDVTESTGVASQAWSASCLVADLNRDGLPDLYDVNYCEGERPWTHECLRASGVPRTCIPTEFSAADDRLMMNLGDGRFEDVTATAGILAPDGRGLGIVAARFDDQPGLDVYVANDMTANFLFLNRTDSPGAKPLFEERGVISGVAYDSDGRSQASMGIAADDANGDGLIDLYVTNFYNEANTLYLQQQGEFFIDATRETALREPSMSTLGFGTQFVDAELDGAPDLVVANGHVDDFTDTNIPFKMRPQFFRNLGSEFVELIGDEVGAFFAENQLGRGLAILDWNRDGRVDFVVSRLIQPSTLVENQTPSPGHYLAVQLVGLHDRDAIGTEVKVTAGGRTWTRQMTSGDGFACANERRLVFGLGDATAVDDVQVRWLDGDEQSLGPLPVDRDILIVEGRSAPLELPASRP